MRSRAEHVLQRLPVNDFERFPRLSQNDVLIIFIYIIACLRENRYRMAGLLTAELFMILADV